MTYAEAEQSLNFHLLKIAEIVSTYPKLEPVAAKEFKSYHSRRDTFGEMMYSAMSGRRNEH